jgi:ribonuclease HI
VKVARKVLHSQLGESKAERRLRVQRLSTQILGPGRAFSGTIWIPDAHHARENDAARLADISVDMALGHAVVYWTDGSLGCSGAKAGFMGAGVAWLNSSKYVAESFELGHATGTNQDAELFAIAAAMGKAKRQREKNKEIRLVRIFSDSDGVLRALYLGGRLCLGPMLRQRTALQGLYERADWLMANGVAVQLVWLKGHSGSEGNVHADKAAAKAVTQQALLREQDNHGKPFTVENFLTDADVPDKWRELGPDWAREWLVRANEQRCEFAPNEALDDDDEDDLSRVAAKSSSEEAVQVSEEVLQVNVDELDIRTNPGDDRASEAGSGEWDWRRYGVTLPKDNLRVNNDLPEDELGPREEVPRAQSGVFDSRHNGFMLPEHHLYGNVTTREAMADLRKKFESVSKDITNLERHIAREATKKSFMLLRANLRKLDIKRDRIVAEFQAQTERLLVQEGDMPLIKIEEL